MNKSIAKGSFDEIWVDDEFYVLKIQNKTETEVRFERSIENTYIQFHFCLKGHSRFHFNEGGYNLPVSVENSLLLYNTQKALPMDVVLMPDSWLLSVVMTIGKFHALFSSEASYIPFLTEANKEKKYYAQEVVSPAIAVVLSQLMNYNLHPSIKKLYVKAKVYELISLYFNRTEQADLEQCPYLADDENIQKIKKAKEIMISRMAEPPTLQELSTEIGLSLKKLKEGFRQIYGDSVYGFLLEYKMDYARKMLEAGKHNVNEVGLKVGYSAASHFIAAFKKKYGTTPKKYITSQY